MDGILLINKPLTWTSFDVVAKVRGLLRKQLKNQDSKLNMPDKKIRVGHTGTLDPLATGLLVILIGNYTKKAEQFSKLDKTYEVSMSLGEVSSTGDNEGDKQEVSRKQPSLKEIQNAFKKFTGKVKQVPPVYSAIKVNGQRAYKLARIGKEVKLEPREVEIYKIELKNYEYPLVKFDCEVSSGTYIRSLVEDLGRTLGTGAYVHYLCRIKVGNFRVEEAISVKKLNDHLISNYLIQFDIA